MVRDIVLQDLDFDEVQVQCRSTSGCRYFRRIRVGVPRVLPGVIEGVFYLYATEDNARQGISPGGTGFIVSHQYEDDGRSFVQHYGVTNWHVLSNGFSVVSLNRRDGSTDAFPFGPEEWESIPCGPDVAVIALDIDQGIHAANSVSTHTFVTRRESLTVGDDVFMVGLFLDHAGISTNTPMARFGHISMLANPRATIEQPRNYHGQSFVIDIHSRTGYSGSPVYVYRTPFSDLSATFPSLDVKVSARQISGQLGDLEYFPSRDIDVELKLPHTLFALLGIHWAQFSERWEIKNPELINPAEESSLVREGAYIDGLSGMTCVIPAWEIMEVLNLPKLDAARKQKAKLRRKAADAKPRLESAKDEGEKSNSSHREDFNDLLDVAVKGKPSIG